MTLNRTSIRILNSRSLVASLLFLSFACATPATGPASAPQFSVTEMASIAQDFDANFVDRVRTKFTDVSKVAADRANADSAFLESLLKKNVMRGFECNAEFNRLLVDEYQVTLRFDDLETIELSRITTCGDVAYASLLAESTENQIYYQRAFLEQLVTEVNAIVKYQETPRSPSGLKLQKLVVLNEKSDAYFAARCQGGASLPISKQHCEAREIHRNLYKKLKDVLNSGLKQNPNLKKSWMPPIVMKFFKDIGI